MARARVVTYECEECGAEVVVTSTGESQLSPIYCCGIEVAEVATKARKPAKKTSTKKPAKKPAKKKVTLKKKPAAKKKATKK